MYVLRILDKKSYGFISTKRIILASDLRFKKLVDRNKTKIIEYEGWSKRPLKSSVWYGSLTGKRKTRFIE